MIIKISGAEFSDCRRYRYALWRIWDENKPKMMFIGLNPSTADETAPDPTITRVCGIAETNGFGGIYMMNCFPFVTADPDLLELNGDALDINNRHLKQIAEKCQEIVFAWGDFKVVKKEGRDLAMRAMFPNAKALHINKSGSPKHPLYCRKTSTLIPFI